jgi:EAL domain-containing protein (putative c-di-GMP-specific phosphodiesterase class I)
VAQAFIAAGTVMSTRRSLATTLMFCGLCGLTVAAIGASIAAVHGALDEAGLAAALGIVAFVQLAILIRNWRHARAAAAPTRPAAQTARVNGLAASAVSDRDRAVDRHSPSGEEPRDAAKTPPPADPAPSIEAVEAAITGVDLLDGGQLDLHLEPVVELSGKNTVYYRSHIALRRQDGSRVGPYLLSLSAERGGFAPALDLALFRRVCPVIRHLKARSRRPGVFCPLSPQSFAARDVLDELVQFLRANQDAAGAMVIELSQSDLAALSPAGMEGLAYLAELGATLSLSQARLEGPDPATLVLLGFRFFELDVTALAGVHGWDAFDEDGEVCRLARRAEQAGLTVIAANVARAEQLERVRAFARLARGPLFAPPRIVRRDITELPVQAAAA